MPPLPDGWQPIDCIAIYKCLDADGEVRVASRVSESLTLWESLGLAHWHAKSLERDILDATDPTTDPTAEPGC